MRTGDLAFIQDGQVHVSFISFLLTSLISFEIEFIRFSLDFF